MRGHRLSGLAVALTLVGALGWTTGALGQSNATKGSTPQGRPFQYIQGQISVLQQQVAAVQTQVNGIEQRLQQQINDILARVGSLQDRVQSVEEATALLRDRIGANEQSITALRDAVFTLQGQLGVLQGQVAQNGDDIAILDASIGSLRDLIHGHELRIASLEDDIARLDGFLASMVNSSCVAGTAVRAVSSNGMLLCTSVGGGGASGTLRTARYTVLFGVPAGVGTFMEVSCANSAEVLASGGYSRVSAPEFELIPYVAAAAWTANGLVVTPGSLRHNPIYVVRDSALSDAAVQTYHVHVRYLPNVANSPGALFAVMAVCQKLQ